LKIDKKIIIELPIKEIIINDPYYKVIITDNKGIHYYFDKDNNYDGYSYDLKIPIENNPN
jgi:hypothetical protein